MAEMAIIIVIHRAEAVQVAELPFITQLPAFQAPIRHMLEMVMKTEQQVRFI